MSSGLHFPNKKVLTDYLLSHPLLKSNNLQEKGITKVVAKLAAARFAEGEFNEVGIRMGAQLMVHDLREGKDGFSGQSLPNLGKLQLPEVFWGKLTQTASRVLIDCALLTMLKEEVESRDSNDL